jgi:hypothetical protein
MPIPKIENTAQHRTISTIGFTKVFTCVKFGKGVAAGGGNTEKKVRYQTPSLCHSD